MAGQRSTILTRGHAEEPKLGRRPIDLGLASAHRICESHMMVDSNVASNAATGRTRRLTVAALLAVVAGGTGWFVSRAQGRIADGCLDDLVNVRMNPEAREIALEAIADGTLRVEGDGAAARDLRVRLGFESFLPGLAECRRIHYLDGEPHADPIQVNGNVVVNVGRARSRVKNDGSKPTGVRISADNPKFGECRTDARGRCFLPFEGVIESDVVAIHNDVEKTAPQASSAVMVIAREHHIVLHDEPDETWRRYKR